MLESRSPVPSPFGKCDGRLDCMVPEALVNALITLGMMQRPRSMPKSEYTRSILERSIFGEWAVLSAKMAHANADPLEKPVVSRDEALTALAMLAGMPVEAYREYLLDRIVFGELSMMLSLAEQGGQGNPGNIGNSLRTAA